MSTPPFDPPSSILIIGAGVFGLSTALALLSRPRYRSTHITILDGQTPNPVSSPQDPNPPTASLDSSRIIRADYAVPAYARLALSAQKLWRQGWGGEGHYHECGLVVTAADGDGGAGRAYVTSSFENVRILEKERGLSVREKAVQELGDGEAIKSVMIGTEGASGSHGYINWGSGWVDAAGAVSEIRARITRMSIERETAGLGKVYWRSGHVQQLLFESIPSLAIGPLKSPTHDVRGALLNDGTTLLAALTILATGAWTSLLLDTRRHLTATGQVVAYIQLTADETARLKDMPVLLNMCSGMFVIPPTPSGELKIARHGYGYRNPVLVPNPEPLDSANQDSSIYTSIPPSGFARIPPEGEEACRAFLATLLPSLSDRPFSRTRTCWYMDTPTADFLIDWHPKYSGLFLATGGSGHAYKFFPVLGEKIVDAVEGKLEDELKDLWRWREGRRGEWVTEDGSRGGRKGMRWEEEMARGSGKNNSDAGLITKTCYKL